MIENKEQYGKYLTEATELAAVDPEAESTKGRRLALLVMLLDDYERQHFQIFPELYPMKDSDPMTFGKYKGTPIGRVPASYLLWFYDQPKAKDSQPATIAYIEANIKALQAEMRHKTTRDEDGDYASNPNIKWLDRRE